MRFAGKLAFIVSLLFLAAETFAENNQPSSRIEELENRVKKLEDKSGDLKPERSSPPPDAPARPSTATGISRAFNPAISVNGLFLGSYRSAGNDNPHADVKTGMDIQEVELQASAYVDTYLRGNLILSMDTVDTIEIEEATADFVPARDLSLRAGKFFAAFGKHNLLHAHQFPFIDQPLANREIFGDKGLNEKGVGFNWLLPAPWYSELIFQFLEGENANLLNSQLNDDFGYLTHGKNLWDLNEDATLELGGSYLYGKNGPARANNVTHAAGGDLTFKWKPARRAKYNTLVWQTEYIAAFKENGVDPVSNVRHYDDKGGVYTLLQYQFARQWWLQGRYDFFGLHSASDANDKQRWSALLAFAPTEFTAVRLQYNYLDYANSRTLGLKDEHQVLLQLNFSMGSHPAHQY